LGQIVPVDPGAVMRGLLISCLIFIAASAPAQAAWRVAESAHFIIYSEDKPENLKAFAEELERFDAAMRFLRKLEPTTDAHTNKLTIFQVSSVGAVQKMMGGKAANVYGFYNGRAGNSIAFVPRRAGGGTSWDIDAQTVLLHEYAHHFMFRNFPFAFPLWFSEGFAELNSTARFVADGSVDLGLPAKHRAGGLFFAAPLPLDTLMQADRRKLNAQALDSLYSKGWLLTHYLSFSKERDGQLSSYLLAINKGTASMDAARASFGDLGKLDNELHRYMNGRRMTYLRVPARRIAAAPVQLRELSPGANAIMPAFMQSRRGVDAESAKTVLKAARAAAAPYPDDPFVQLALAEAEIDAGNLAEADKAADQVLKAEPNNVRALVFKGRVAVSRLQDGDKATPEEWKAARRWFTRANRAEPGAPEPLIQFYQSFPAAGEKPTANAVEGLRSAAQLAAEDEGLRLMLGHQMLVDGKGPEARAALAPAAYHPHGGGLAAFAARVIAAIDAGGAEAGLKAWREKPAEADADKDAS
jgi:tetratricopeptide (TPR) repeat protein